MALKRPASSFTGVNAGGYIDETPSHVIDIGGGNTEVIVGKKHNIVTSESLDMGARRYSKQFFSNKTYQLREINRCRRSAASKIQSVVAEFKQTEINSVYGTSGTIRTLAELSAKLHNHQDLTHLSLHDLESTLPTLINRLKDGKDIESIEKERRDTLVAGTIILIEVMSALNIKSLRVCPSALREGIIYDHLETNLRIPSQPIKASVDAMAKRCNLNQTQIERVSTTAKHIFNHYADTLNLDAEVKQRLVAACQLHELGLLISHKRTHLHGSYMISHASVTDITQRQQRILAAIVRFHLKAKPSKKGGIKGDTGEGLSHHHSFSSHTATRCSIE